MGSRVTVTRNFHFTASFGVSPETARTIGEGLLTRIRQRTLRGRDEQQGGFIPYSEKYARARGISRSPVTLKRSGQMQDDMAVITATSKLIQLGFRTPEMAQRAAYHDSLAPRTKMPLRRFLGITPSWVVEIVREVRKGLQRKPG